METRGGCLPPAPRRGLAGVSFREVAAEAGISVSLIQHYFGTKEQLLIDTVNMQSTALGTWIMQRVAELGPGATPLDRVGAVVAAFLPTDDERRARCCCTTPSPPPAD